MVVFNDLDKILVLVVLNNVISLIALIAVFRRT
jgi:hypothetical protein